MNVAGSDLSFTLEFDEKALDPIAIAGRLNKRPAMAGKVLIWPDRAMLEMWSNFGDGDALVDLL